MEINLCYFFFIIKNSINKSVVIKFLLFYMYKYFYVLYVKKNFIEFILGKIIFKIKYYKVFFFIIMFLQKGRIIDVQCLNIFVGVLIYKYDDMFCVLVDIYF